jgi:hypothetical protein
VRFGRLIGMTITDEALGHLLDPAPNNGRRMPGRRTWLVAAAVAGVLLVVVAFAIGGGNKNNSARTSQPLIASPSGGDSGAAKSAPVPQPATAGAAAGGVAGSTTAGGAGVVNGFNEAAPPSLVPGDVGAKVVKTGEMDLEVAKGQVPHTLDRLIGLATVKRGFVAESHSSDGGTPSGSVTLRIPVQAFDDTLTSVRQLPGKVTSQQTAGEDVTSKYVDLQARIHSLSSTRSAFERLLSRATSIGDTLAVQSRLTNVQTQIEQLQGQLRVLGDQATFGTLTVTVAEKGKAAVTPHHASGMSQAVHRSVDRFVNGIEAIVGIIGPLLLVALLAGLAWLVGRVAYRRIRRQPA